VENAGIIAVVGEPEDLSETRIGLVAVEQLLEVVGRLDAAILADAEEENAVDGALHREVEVFDAELRIMLGDVSRKGLAPAFDVFKEGIAERFHAFAAFAGGVLVERAAQNRFAGKHRGDFIPAFGKFGVFDLKDGRGAGLVFGTGLVARIVNNEVPEIRQDRQRQLRGVGVAAELKRRCGINTDADGGFLGFEKEFASAAPAGGASADVEAIVGRLGGAADLDGVFIDNFAVSLGISLVIVDVPSQRLEHGIDEVDAKLGLAVLIGLVDLRLLGELPNLGEDGLWAGNARAFRRRG